MATSRAHLGHHPIGLLGEVVPPEPQRSVVHGGRGVVPFVIAIDVDDLLVPTPAVDFHEEALGRVRGIYIPIDRRRRVWELKDGPWQPTKSQHPQEHRLGHALWRDIARLTVLEDRSHETHALAASRREIVERRSQLGECQFATSERIIDNDLHPATTVDGSEVDHRTGDGRDA